MTMSNDLLNRVDALDDVKAIQFLKLEKAVGGALNGSLKGIGQSVQASAQ
jgi:hypothetical protein